MSEDLAHDAHLRAALRHAPDHALSPPSGLSQTILAAARQAHQPARPSVAPPPVRMRAAGRRPVRRWLAGLFAPRWAGAWAAGLIAALGIGLWLDLGSQPVLERTDSVAMSTTPPAPTPRTEAARAPTSSGDAAVAEPPVAETLAKAAAPAPAPATQQPPATAAAGTAAAAAGTRIEERSAARRKETAGATQGRVASMATPMQARQDAVTAEPAAQGAVAAPADSKLADSGVGASAAAAAPRAQAQPPAPAAARANDASSAPAIAALAPETTDLRATLAARGARKVEPGETVAAASPALTLLRRVQAELATGSANWTWAPPGSAAMAPWDDAAQAWLSRLVYAARGRWVDVSERGESLDALEVRWWRDGWPHATLRIEADGLRWIEPGGRIRYAPLDAGTLQRLRSF